MVASKARKVVLKWAVIVAQLVELSLPIPEVRGSNPVIGKKFFISIEHLFTINCVLEKTKIKKKRPGMAHFFKKSSFN